MTRHRHCFFRAPTRPFHPLGAYSVITGFLGGLTTFSTFSAEAMALLQNGEYGWALGHSALHVFGSIAFCFAGYAAYKMLAGV